MPYEFINQITTDDFSDSTIEHLYDQGFVFTRLGRGRMNQVRSLRVDLAKFSPTSENRRVLKKSEGAVCSLEPLPYAAYHWSIGKMAHDFYSQKFGEGTMSANKIKELFCDPEKSNMNSVFVYSVEEDPPSVIPRYVVGGYGGVVGYCLAYETGNIIHYSYPFYTLDPKPYSLTGIAMMTKAILWSQEHGKRYVYLGSVHETNALYKLQFEGLEWWNGEEWSMDIHKLKQTV